MLEVIDEGRCPMTIVATSLAKGSADEASAAITGDLRKKLGASRPSFVLAMASTKQPLGTVATALVGSFPGVPIFGASTAGEFTEQGDAKGSVAAIAVSGDYKVFAGMGTGLKADPEKAAAAALDGLPRQMHGYPHCTGLLLLDPLAGNGEEATLTAASLLGPNVPLAGGAAGDDLDMKQTHLACGGEAKSDAVVIALVFSKQPLGLGVCHGHEPLSGPLRVTKARGSVVYEIEGKPAWDVWLDATASHASQRGVNAKALRKEEEGAYLLRYEAGLATGSAYKIRAPLSRSGDGSISFACGIAEGAVVRITQSTPAKQIESARKAAKMASKRLQGPAAGAVVFDCICRNLILAGEFGAAVRGMSEELGNVPLAGFETYGEIALDAGDMSGFHNTTSVVLAFPR
jgi:methyl-accepting chemotaxis protein